MVGVDGEKGGSCCEKGGRLATPLLDVRWTNMLINVLCLLNLVYDSVKQFFETFIDSRFNILKTVNTTRE